MVPALRPHVKHIFNYVRGKTWLSPPFASNKLSELMKCDPGAENCESSIVIHSESYFNELAIDAFTEKDRETFKDPQVYRAFRHDLESELNVRSSSSTI